MERARNTIETGIVSGLESLGGFGGVADRLNTYEHYLGTPDYLQQDVARYRARHAGAVKAFARDHLTPTARVVVRLPAARAAGAGPDAAGAEAGRRGHGRRRSTPTSRGARTSPRRPASSGAAADARSRTLPNGLTVILNERGRCRSSPRSGVQHGERRQPARQARTRELHRGDAGRRHQDAQRALQIADEVARLGASLGTGSSMDATTISGRSLSSTFPARVRT